MSDRIFAGVWLLLCLAGLVVGWQIHSEYSYEPVGPRPFPLGILALMALCALALLLRHPDAISWPDRPVLQKLLILVATLLLYAGLFEAAGFPVATTALTLIMGRLFGARVWVAGLAGLLLGVTLWYLFDRLLDVTLPPGILLS